MIAALNISVTPRSVGWAVECEAVCEPVSFISGGRAEAHAKAMAVALSRAGYGAEVTINDRSGRVVAIRHYPRHGQGKDVERLLGDFVRPSPGEKPSKTSQSPVPWLAPAIAIA